MYAHKSAKTIEIAKQINQIAAVGLLKACETFTAVNPRTMKLYGHINPNTKSGGCQGGRTKDAYQPGDEFTQMPEPKA